MGLIKTIFTAKRMNDANKTKEQLVNELMAVREHVDVLENDKVERRKKEHALLLTQFTVDRAADAIFWMTSDAKFSFVNEAACRSLGYSREELLSMTVHDIDSNFPAEAWPEHWDDVKKRESFVFESSHSAKNGSVFPVEITVNYLKFNGNEYNCAFARNITERKKAEENWQNIFQAIGHPTVILDADHYVLAANRATVTATGKALQDIIGKKCHEVFHGTHEPPEGCPFEKMLLSGNFETATMEVETLGGIYLVSCTPVMDSAGRLQKVIHIATDITEQKRAEEALKNSEERYRQLVENAPIGIYYSDFDGRFLYGNKKAEEIVGYKKEELIGESFLRLNLLGPEEIFKAVRLLDLNRHGQSTGPEEFTLNKKDGSSAIVEISCLIITVKGEKLILGMVQDITERKKKEEEIKKFKFISDNANDAHFLVDRDAKFRYVNETACRMLGYSEEELLTLGVTDVDIDYGKEKFRELFDLIQKEKIPPIQTVNKRKDESTFCSEISATGYQIEGVPYMFTVLREITERKEVEEKINKALKEKEILLKEIHHRVKNNMSVVSSLLRLQAGRVADARYKAMFNDSIGRIMTMASIHEKLYQSEDLSKIIFSDYIKDMVNNVYKSYGPGSRIKLVTDIEKITLGIDVSTPCGLIVNELITNSMKYAFPEGREGEIRVSLHMNDKDEIKLVIADNGVGMPEELDFRNADSLGLILVNALVRQLNGKIELSRDKGTEFMIIFNG